MMLSNLKSQRMIFFIARAEKLIKHNLSWNVWLLLHIFVCMVLCSGAFAGDKGRHRDPAPLPDDVATMFGKRAFKGSNSVISALERHLDEVVATVKELEEEDQKQDVDVKEEQIAAKKAHLSVKNKELKIVRDEVRNQFAEIRKTLLDVHAQEQIKEWDALLDQIEVRFDRVGKSLEAVYSSNDKNSRKMAVSKARKELYELHEKTKVKQDVSSNNHLPTLRPEFVPSSQDKPLDSAPPPAYMMSKTDSRNNVYAFNGNTLLAPPPATPTEATVCGYTNADRGESQEVQLTQEIRDLAASLNFSPVKIFEYVSNEIKLQPSYGSLKGAIGTLVSKSGGPTDQASLLIALLRASNIPARYVKGVVSSNDVTNWFEVKGQAAAWGWMASASNPYVDYNNSGGLKFNHVWVEACVPYAHYRGARMDNAGHRWIALDPSYKNNSSYQSGIATNVNFDYEAYFAHLTMELPFEAYEQQVENHIKGIAPLYGNNTLEDVPYRTKQSPLKIDILPASLPYEVISFIGWNGVSSSAETAEVPDSHRYKFKMTLKYGTSPYPVILPTTTFSLPQMLLKPITISFKGATAGHQAALDAWRKDGKIEKATSPTPCTIAVVPVIKLDGVDQAIGSVPVGLCTTNSLEAQVVPTDSYQGTGSMFSILTSSIDASSYYAEQVYGFQASDRLINERAAKLIQSIRTTANANDNLEQTLGEFLHLVGLKFMRYESDSSERIAELDGACTGGGFGVGSTSTKMKVQYLFGLPFAVNSEGFLIDIRMIPYGPGDLTSGLAQEKTFRLLGYNGSAYESYVWQENARIDALSTTRGLQFAHANGIEVLELTSANWASQSGKLTSNIDSTLNHSSGDITKYKQAIDKGCIITIPRSLLRYGDWKGAVWAELSDWETRRDSDCGGYLISGGFGGGETISSDPTPYIWNPETGTGWVNPYTGPYVDSAISEVGDGMVGPGVPRTAAGDPVDMVTGNMYHIERDLSIKGRGLPLVFERSYNSRNAEDGPLGYGWTHSFNHYLTFNSGTEGGNTSFVTWNDGTGARKKAAVAGAPGGVTTGSVFTPVTGFFFKMNRNSGGTFTVTEKNGLTFTFEGVAGMVGQKAKLLSIKDRNNNTLTMGYDGNNLTSVSDGLSNRILTISYTGSRISEIRDWTQRVHKYEYDGNGNLQYYKNPLVMDGKQNPVVYEYYGSADGVNINHAMKKYTLPRGNGMTFEYYNNGRVFRHTNTLGETNTFSFNDFRRETVQVNERGNTRRFFFNEYGNPIKIVEENGATRTYTYGDSANPYNRTAKRDPEGYETKYDYDVNGNVTRITNPSNTMIEFSYFNDFNQPGKVKDANGNYTINKYDAVGNLIHEIKLKQGVGQTINPVNYSPDAADISAWTINSYGEKGIVTSSRKVRDIAKQVANLQTLALPVAENLQTLAGSVYEFEYNDMVNNIQGLNLVGITRRGDKDGDGIISATEKDSVTLVYDGLGRVKNGITGDWYPTRYDYDKVDRIERGSDALGNMRDYKFDANGNATENKLVIQTDGTSKVVDLTSADYDMSDRKQWSRDAGGFTTYYVYDAAGNLVKITNPDNFTLGLEYDKNNHVIKAFDQEGNSVTKTYDLSGKMRSVTDPNGNGVKYEYFDSIKNGRLKKQYVTSNSGNQFGASTEYDYDANGNVIRVSQVAGTTVRTTLTSYDELNRPVRMVGPEYTDTILGRIRPVTKYSYNPLGNLTAVEAGHTTDLTGTGSAADHLALQMSYAYDDFGRKISETDPLGHSWNFEYNINNNIVKSTDARQRVVTYQWDYGHQLKTRSNVTDGTLTYSRNPLGQVTKAEMPETTYAYGYDATHRLMFASDSRGFKALNYGYTPGGMLSWMQELDGKQTQYLYDPVGRLTAIQAPNNDVISFMYDKGGRLIAKNLPQGLKDSYQYYPNNLLSSVSTSDRNSSRVSYFYYLRDDFGNTVESNAQKYIYDELSRLTEVRNFANALVEGYSYDPVGNRRTKTNGSSTSCYLYDAANQLKEIHLGSEAGQLQASYEYDENGNQLSKTAGGTTTSFIYNAFNQLKSVTKPGSAPQSYRYDDQGRRIARSSGAITTNYHYNGSNIIAEYTDWNRPPVRYTHGMGTDDPLVRSDSTSSSYYLRDGLGSVVKMVNQAGAVSATLSYDAWGNSTGDQPAGVHYGYTGREPDASGLIYYRARYYDPTIGRFTQRDPIGLKGGINQYVYVNNNPVNFVDPMGLNPSSPGEPPQIINNVTAGNQSLSPSQLPVITDFSTKGEYVANLAEFIEDQVKYSYDKIGKCTGFLGYVWGRAGVNFDETIGENWRNVNSLFLTAKETSGWLGADESITQPGDALFVKQGVTTSQATHVYVITGVEDGRLISVVHAKGAKYGIQYRDDSISPGYTDWLRDHLVGYWRPSQ